MKRGSQECNGIGVEDEVDDCMGQRSEPKRSGERETENTSHAHSTVTADNSSECSVQHTERVWWVTVSQRVAVHHKENLNNNNKQQLSQLNHPENSLYSHLHLITSSSTTRREILTYYSIL